MELNWNAFPRIIPAVPNRTSESHFHWGSGWNNSHFMTNVPPCQHFCGWKSQERNWDKFFFLFFYCTSSVNFSACSVMTLGDNNRIILEFPLNRTEFSKIYICFPPFCGYPLCSWWVPIFRIKKQVRTLLRLGPCWGGSDLRMKISTVFGKFSISRPPALSCFKMEKQNGNHFC